MRIEEFLEKLSERDIYLDVEDDQLKIYAEKSLVTKKILQELKNNKNQIIGFLKNEGTFKTPSDFTLPGLKISEYKDLLNENNISVYDVQDIYNLTSLQEGLLFHSMMDKDSSAYFEQVSLDVRETLDMKIFEEAWQQVGLRHDVLRTLFISDFRIPVQVVLKSRRIEFSYIDLRGDTDKENRLAEIKRLDRCKTFNLKTDPLFRIKVVQLENDKYTIIISFQHIIMDGWCTSILFSEFITHYTKLINNEEISLDSPPKYSSFIKWFNEQHKEKSLKYWKSYLEGYEELSTIPKDRIVDYKGEEDQLNHSFSIDKKQTNSIKKLANEMGVTLNTLIQTVWGIILSRYNGTNDVVFGSTVSGRPQGIPQIEEMVGLFINTIPVRIKIDPNNSFGEIVQEVQKNALECINHHHSSLAEIQSGNGFNNALLDHIMVFENYPIDKSMMEKGASLLKIGDTDTFEQINYDFGITISSSDYLNFKFSYNPKKYNAEHIVQISSHIKKALEEIISNKDIKLSDIEIIPEREKNLLLNVFNDTYADYPKDKTIVDLFEEQVEKTPDNIAVVYENIELTYTELNQKSNIVAHYLREHYEIKPDDLIGVLLDRSEKMVIALLGILKSGAAYVPIDPEYPEERINYMLEDSAPKVVLSEKTDSIRSNIEIIDINKCLRSNNNIENLDKVTGVDNLAYVIYTSGSTGKPKGTLISNKSVINLTKGITDVIEFNEGKTILSVTTYSFDIFVLESLIPLSKGLKIVIAGVNQQQDPFALCKLIEMSHIDIIQTTPSRIKMLTSEKSLLASLSNLTEVIIGGESFSENLLKILNKHCNGKIYNMYGPTETTVWSTLKLLNGEKSINIGKPIANTKIYILNDNFNVVPVGVSGELCISGDGLARGYLNKPGLTNEKFTENPLKPDERMYRTGDLARWLPDGNIEYLGRMDHQVKIRGFRIELDDIKSHMLNIATISNPVVIAKKDSDETHSLFAYYTINENQRNIKVEEENIIKWQNVYRKNYREEDFETDAEFAINCWISSYTGQQFKDDEMQEWVNHTVRRIKHLNPKHVYEIGSGSGLLLYRIAQECETYLGVDFSEDAVTNVNKTISTNKYIKNKARVVTGVAHEFDIIDKKSVDTIIINSVIQYFPNVFYLFEVIKNSVDRIKPGGHLFLGDIRNFDLLYLFHSSISIFRSDESLSINNLKTKINHSIDHEKELLISPAFFLLLKQKIKRISHIEIKYKKGNINNELSKFRYDVILHIERKDKRQYVKEFFWNKNSNLSDIVDVLKTESPDLLSITKVPYDRIEKDSVNNRLIKLKKISNIKKLLSLSDKEPLNGIPFSYFENIEKAGYHLDFIWSGIDLDQYYDVVFKKNKDVICEKKITTVFNKPLTNYSNNPVKEDLKILLKKEIREYLVKKIPEYMIPSHFIALDYIPMTFNGKIDRNSLPDPMNPKLSSGIKYIEPRNEIEKTLVEIWQEILGFNNVGIKDNFFHLGGHSLKATRLVLRINKKLQKSVALKEIFNNPTIESLAELLNDSVNSEYHQIEPVTKQNSYQVSNAQRRLWVLDQLEENSIAYNMPGTFFLEGKFNEVAFEKAYSFILKRHESLRTVFVTENGDPRQKVLENVECDIEILDLRKNKKAENTAKELVKKDILTPFNLEKGPLVRFNILRMEDEKYLILFNMHHIISDGWSMEILNREFLSFYNSFNENKIPGIESLRIHYKDYSTWQNALLESSDMYTQRDYWLKKLSGDIPILNLPTDKVRPAVQTYNGKSVGFHLSDEVNSELNKLCKENHISLFMILQALVKILFFRYTGQEDIILGSPIAGRVHEDLENQIGLYVNTLVFRDTIKSNFTFSEILDSIKKTCTEAFDNQAYPFDRLVDDLDLRRDLSRSPLFDVMLVLQNNEEKIIEVNNIDFSSYETENVISKFDITFNFMEGNNGLYGGIEYNTDIYTDDRILRMIKHLMTLVTSIINNHETKIKDLEMIPETEKNLILSFFDDTYVDYPKDKTIVDLFEEQVLKTPDNTALVIGEAELTYKELNKLSNKLARHLVNEGVKQGDHVGIIAERGFIMIIGLFSILKAGGVYVPMDPEYPKNRKEYIVKNSDIKTLIQDKEYDVDCANCLSLNYEVFESYSDRNLKIHKRPDDLAYIIYTSGSTGNPKGVMIKNHSITNLIDWVNTRFKVNETDRLLFVTSISFDLSVYDVFGMLASGGSVVISENNDIKNPEILFRLLKEKSITFWDSTPSTLNYILDSMDEKNQEYFQNELRLIFMSGDWIPVNLLKKIKKYFPNANPISLGGATEGTVWSIYYPIDPEREYKNSIPYGKPINNNRFYILDKDLNLVPNGVIGELYIGGDGVAAGYINDNKKTEYSFVKDIIINSGNQKMYRTGDYGKMLPDGNIEFLGRIDSQIKIRGFRVELGEIENSLLQNEFINSVVVINKEHTNGGKELVAYYVSDIELKISELRSFLSQTLPGYMIPSWFVPMDTLPLTNNGKIDRRALPDPETSGISTGNEYIAPGNDIEKLLVSVWQDVMGSRNNIGIDDNFFELGGDSIKAIQVIARLSQEGLKGEIASIFSSPTIREFSLLVKKSIKKIDQSSVEGELPLTPIQNWFFNDFKCEKHHFNQAVMLNFKESIDVEKLKLLKESAKGLINHHDALRMRYRQIDGNVIQENRSESELYFKEYDVGEDENHEQKINEIANTVQSSFNLEDDTLIRFVFFRLKKGRCLLIVAHHLIIDGVSWRILVNDLESGYRQRSENKKIILPLKTTSFKAWSHKLTEYAASPDFKKEALFWKEQNSRRKNTLPEVGLNKNKENAYSTISLNKETLLTKTNQAFNTGINDILLASLTRAISRWCGNTKICIDLESHGRSERFDDIDLSRTIGWFTSTYPVALDITDCEDIGDHIINVKEQLRQIPDNGIGYGIYRYLTENNDNPKYESEILFNYLGQFDEDLDTELFRMASESTGESVSSQASSSYKLNFNGMVAENEFSMTLNSDVYKKETLDEIQLLFKDELIKTILFCESSVNFFDKLNVKNSKSNNAELEDVYI